MESKFGKNATSSANKSTIGTTGYGGKAKTGTPKTKLKSPKQKAVPATIVSEDKKPRKSKERLDRVPARSSESSQNPSKNEDHTIPNWVRESSEKKSPRKEGAESKLQWRKETKKSQRSFSKNKERDYQENKEPNDYNSEKLSKNPDRVQSNWGERKEFSKKEFSKKEKPSIGRGFEKSNTGYKGTGHAWNKELAPIKSTRKWDFEGEKKVETSPEKKSFPKPSLEKDTKKKNTESIPKKSRETRPAPTWEKNTEVIDKKNLKDPTQF